jgi:hypothetical protein
MSCGEVMINDGNSNELFHEFMCSDFVDDWVKIGLPAKAKVKAKFGHLRPHEQNHKCEKVIIIENFVINQ